MRWRVCWSAFDDPPQRTREHSRRPNSMARAGHTARYRYAEISSATAAELAARGWIRGRIRDDPVAEVVSCRPRVYVRIDRVAAYAIICADAAAEFPETDGRSGRLSSG